ncbi:MAG: glycosyltransferase family 39 protein, partial [Chloroflexota bacterium]
MALLENTKAILQDKNKQSQLVLIALVLIVAWGAYLRLVGINWDDYTHIHPDERFLTGLTAEIGSPESFQQYLQTSESPLNVYNLREVFYVYGNLPMTATFYVARTLENFRPAFCAEGALGPFCLHDLTTYEGVHIVGRLLSALLDTVTIVITFLIGTKLYGRRIGLLGAFFFATAAMAIQQSHFYTSDNWSVLFITLSLYAAINIAEDGNRPGNWLLFGIWLGLAAASRVNVGVMAIISVVAALVWVIRQYRVSDTDGEYTRLEFWQWLRSKPSLDTRKTIVLGLIIAGLTTFTAFRLAMPYAFADAAIAEQKGYEAGTLGHRVQVLFGFNPTWTDDIEEVLRLHDSDSTFPPVLQWMGRADLVHPLINIGLWGMGPLAGFLAFAGVGLAGWQIMTGRKNWLTHLVPISWIAVYFLYTGTQFTKIMRYFLAIYPILAVMAAWLIITLWRELEVTERLRGTFSRLSQLSSSGLPTQERVWTLAIELLRPTIAAAAVLAILGSFVWSFSFSRVYTQPITRVQATEWIFDNVPSAATLVLDTDTPSGKPYYQLPLRELFTNPDGADTAFVFRPREAIKTSTLRFNYVNGVPGNNAQMNITIRDVAANAEIASGTADLFPDLVDSAVEIPISTAILDADKEYEIRISHNGVSGLNYRTSILTSEHWDDSLPQRYGGRDPFSEYYYQSPTGQMTTYHADNEQKRGELVTWIDD